MRSRSVSGATLKAMATEEQKNVFDENIAESPSAGDIFVDQPASPADFPALAAHEQLSAHDVFVGDEDFYKLLQDSAEDSPADPAVTRRQSEERVIRRKGFSSVQRMLAVSIVAVASILVYVLVKYPSGRLVSPAPTAVGNVTVDSQQRPVSEPSVTESVQAEPEQTQEPSPVISTCCVSAASPGSGGPRGTAARFSSIENGRLFSRSRGLGTS